MGNGVVYITNHDRKYSSMKRVCDELKAEGQISAQCRTLFIEDGAEWDASLAAAMQGSNLVIVHLMKNAMNTPLWNHCRDFYVTIRSLFLLMLTMEMYRTTGLLMMISWHGLNFTACTGA